MLLQIKIKHVLVENGLNILSEKVKAIFAKGLTKDLINKFSFLNGATYFSSGIFQKIRNLMESQNKILKI